MKKVARNFSIYALPDIISRFLPFFTLPITTAYLSLKDFGSLALFSLCTVPFIALTEYGADYVIFSSWFKYDKRQQGELLFTLIVISIVLHVTAILVLGISYEKVLPIIIGKDWASIRDLYWWLILMVLSQIPSSLFRSWVVIEEKAILSTTIQIIAIALGTGIMLAVTILTQNYRYIIMGNVIAACIISSIKMAVLIPRTRLRFKKEYFVLMYKVGSPKFFSSLFIQVRKQIDKFYVANQWGGSQFALYNFSYQFFNLYKMFSSSFNKSYEPGLYEQLSAGKLQLLNLRRILFLWIYGTFFACTLFFVLGKPAIDLLTHGVFSGAYPLMLLFSCCVVILLPFLANSLVVIYHQETKYLLFCTVISSAVALLGCVIFVPRYGAIGGILSIWLSVIVNGLLVYRKKQKYLPDLFVEKIIWPYVSVYHILVIMKALLKVDVPHSFVVFIFIVLTIHGYLREKEYISFLYRNKFKAKLRKLHIEIVK